MLIVVLLYTNSHAMGECNAILSAYTKYRHLGCYCTHPTNDLQVCCITRNVLHKNQVLVVVVVVVLACRNKSGINQSTRSPEKLIERTVD